LIVRVITDFVPGIGEDIALTSRTRSRLLLQHHRNRQNTS